MDLYIENVINPLYYQVTMLSEIELSHFKGIKSGTVSELSDINILIGPNNSGKSTILDSIYLLNHIYSPSNMFGEHIPSYITLEKAGDTNFESLNYKYKSGKYSSIKPVLKNKTTNLDLELLYDMSGWRIDDSISIEDSVENNSVSRTYKFKDYHINIKNFITAINDVDVDKINNIESVKKYFTALGNSIYPTFYMHSGVSQKQVGKKAWGELYQERSDKKLVEILNGMYDLDVEQLSYVPNKDDREFRALFDDYAAQIGTLGDGFEYAFSLFSGIEAFSPSTVLIDEPESHQDPSAYDGLTSALKEYATELDAQFFIATHSLDFLNSLIDDRSEYDVDVSISHLSLTDGTLNARNINKIDTELLTDLGVDPIRLQEYHGESDGA